MIKITALVNVFNIVIVSLIGEKLYPNHREALRQLSYLLYEKIVSSYPLNNAGTVRVS